MYAGIHAQRCVTISTAYAAVNVSDRGSKVAEVPAKVWRFNKASMSK